MKRFALLIFSLLGQGLVWGQLETYSGVFEDGSTTYTYRENGLNRIFEGNFSYKSADGKKTMSGKYVDDMKNGLWKIDWFGFHEEVTYVQGVKHGAYRLSYRDENNKMEIRGSFYLGFLYSLYFEMENSSGRSMIGEYKKSDTLNIWSQTMDGKYVISQYFYKEIYAGSTLYDNSTGDWGNNTIDDISSYIEFLDTLEKYNYQLSGRYYFLQPQKENQFLKKLSTYKDIFIQTPYWYNEIAYFFIYNFHQSCFGSSLWRGEVSMPYTLCFMLKEDEDRMRQEKARIERERLENERKERIERNYNKAIAIKTTEFNQSEYGKLVAYLKPFASQSKELFDQAKYDYIRHYLGQYSLASGSISLWEWNHRHPEGYSGVISARGPRLARSSGFNYFAENGKTIRFNMSNISSADGLWNFSVFVIPTALVLINERWVVSDAVIVYYNASYYTYIDKWLNDSDFKKQLAKDGYLIHGAEFSITDDYVFDSYYGKKTLVQITPDTKYKKNKIYYDIWHNPELSTEKFIRSITKEDVERSIQERFNIQKEK